MKKTLILCLAFSGVTACNLTGDPTNSSFATPSRSGALNEAGGFGARSGSDFSDVTGNGYGYQVGSVTDDGLQGFSGIVPGASVNPGSGVATYTGTFELALVGSISASDTFVSGSTTQDRGTISIGVDFVSGSVDGGGRGLNLASNDLLNGNELEIDGRIGSGSALSGTVTYNGVSGPLRGLAGDEEVIGAFHGHTDSQVHAGGFIAN